MPGVKKRRTMSRLLYRIATHLFGIDYDELTTAEKAIADMLVTDEWLGKDCDGELYLGPKSRAERKRW